MPVSALIGVALTRSLRSLPIEWLLGYPISNAPTPMIDFLFFLRSLNVFRYLVLLRSYEAKCVQLGCFHRESTSLYSNVAWTESSPSTILGIRKLETLGCPKVKAAFPRFDTIPECD